MGVVKPDALTESATTLAGRLRSGDLTSRELVQAHLNQIAVVNPSLNAFVAMREEAALAEADAADAKLSAARTSGSADSLPPLLGVPCSIKETFELTGMPQTSGMVSRRDHVSSADAPPVARLREAGAIPLGVTNVSELTMWIESYNKVYGRTKNPYDPSRTCGGSSGGEGAAIGSGMSPFGLGTDIGGSLRLPAFFCGITSHKPSGGLVTTEGQFPVTAGEAARYNCTGPLARRTEDLMPLLRIIGGPEAASALQDPATVSLEGMKVTVIRGDGVWHVRHEVRTAQQRAVDALAAAGAEITEAKLPALKAAGEIWSSMVGASLPPFREWLTEGEPFHGGREVARLMSRRSPHTAISVTLALAGKLAERAPGRAAKMTSLGERLRAEVEGMLEGNAVILYPPYPQSAPKHKAAMFPPVRVTYTAIWNVLQTPVTQVPMGVSRRGLPMGVQVIAGHGQDHRSIAVAQHLEQIYGGWLPPWRAAPHPPR